MERTPLLRMEHINKGFPGVQALDDVHFEVFPGEIHALVGENGAGKSTLMKLLSGAHQRDSGTISWEGRAVEIDTPRTSQHIGISTIYQELMLTPDLTIAENIFLGREPAKSFGRVDTPRMLAESERLLSLLEMPLDPRLPVKQLSIAQQQMVEVAKALSQHARLIIMDEPTSSLTDHETLKLFEVARNLKQQGVSIVFISHRLAEVFTLCDRVTVLRDGKYVATAEVADVTREEMIQWMVGRQLGNIFVKEEAEIGETILEVQHLSTDTGLQDINFTLCRGEILGFAGLVGAGRTEVMRAIFGADRRTTGTIRLKGQPVNIMSPEDAIKHNIGFMPEDRKQQALFLGLAVRMNITSACMKKVCQDGVVINSRIEHDLAQRFVEAINIKTPGLEQKVMNLSGGNQQKVVLSKWLATEPEILIVDEPTRGIDVGSKKEIHALLSRLARQGIGIIMISSELPEIIGMSDRVVVMHEGRISGILDEKAQMTQENIMRLATQ
ncbi:ATP-binding cassette domain-containing protein [candidate division KSB3 bacterium]|uniref:ATP-binding cassette domain-containing protein n=1 Tax=candidate division KSB3 bacterium TaxID=2044937 RepID=A0A9D5Q4Y9_9BACT|nr:ATP-binding cassette domain-containing protein [candidate division KSB3 bacterium]MBD3324239.1 ATP-binding cassette domain-containing protein [candidate division KSB3 bacterium]